MNAAAYRPRLLTGWAPHDGLRTVVRRQCGIEQYVQRCWLQPLVRIQLLTDTAKQLVPAYVEHAKAIQKLQQRIKVLEEKRKQ